MYDFLEKWVKDHIETLIPMGTQVICGNCNAKYIRINANVIKVIDEYILLIFGESVSILLDEDNKVYDDYYECPKCGECEEDF